MKRGVRNVFQTTLILVIFGIAAQAQPTVVTEIPNGSFNLVKAGDFVYFVSGDSLLRTDGTDPGTLFVKSGFNTRLSALTEFNNMLFFISGNELWRSDGTPGGTIQLTTKSELEILSGINGTLFFQGSDAATGLELYKTDGTSEGTMLVKDIHPGPGDGFIGSSGVLGDNLFFRGNNAVNGDELWKTDGTAAGTVMVQDINPGSGDGFLHGNPYDPRDVYAYNNLFYFTGYTLAHGQEPWVSDGTAAGTFMLKDVVAGADDPAWIVYGIGHDGAVYFIAKPRAGGSGSDATATLWKTSGTTASTVSLGSLIEDNTGHEDGVTYRDQFRIYNGKVYFFGLHYLGPHELWVTDGTPAGTHDVYTLSNYGGGYTMLFFEVVNGYMLFYGTEDAYPTALYRSNGTTEGTAPWFSFNSGGHDAFPGDLTVVGDLLFYGDHSDSGKAYGEPGEPDEYFHLFQADGVTRQSMLAMYGVPTIGTKSIVDYNGKVIFSTRNDQDESTDRQKYLWIYDPAGASEPRASFTLVDADTDKDLQTINEGDVITKSESSNINIRYNAVETPGSVVFNLNGANVKTESAPPYSLAGDINGDYAPWQEANPGSYELTATPYSESGGTGTAGTPFTVTFTIEGTPSGSCTASGAILREYWEGAPGSRVSDIPLHTEPTSTSQLSIFEGPTNAGTNYGARVHGYICPPTTGDYVFWIASNDHSELWLSTDDNMGNKVRIAYVEGATTPRQWNKFATQKSAPVPLTAGQRYYIMALHKQGVGTDNLAVGWQLPDGTMERPIAGSRLSPFSGSSSNTPPMVSLTSPEEGQSFTEPATVVIEADASDDDGSIAKVEFYEGTNKLGEDLTAPYAFTWNDVPAGSYTLMAVATDDEGSSVDSEPINITVRSGCMASGTITREYWGGVEGSQVSDVPVNSPPTSVSELTIFEGPSNVGVHYGSRIRGYICPPETGNYTFYISSNDHSELWLSTDADPANKVRIAWVMGATGERQWNKFASQQSMPVVLAQGETYYIEAIHKQGVGSDNLAVGWQIPGGTFERPIPGSRLSPFGMNDAARMASVVEEDSGKETLYSQIGIYPNPVERNNAELRMSGYEGISEAVETHVEIISLTGEVVYAERIRCGGDCGAYLVNINKELVPGVYMVNMRTNGARFSKRLLVK